jgi:diguanylate cyclase (GGDEF)-like protein
LVAAVTGYWPIVVHTYTIAHMPGLIDELEAVLGELLERFTADEIFVIVGKTGLRVDWELTPEEAYSDKTRKRAYGNRVNGALGKLDDQGRKLVLSHIATQIRPASAEMSQDDLLPLFARKQYELDLVCSCSEASLEKPLALVMVDIDHFKSVNDTFGHAAGDEALIAIASVLKRTSEGKGAAYRYGGEEMCLLLPNFDSGEAVGLAERARREIATLRFESVKRQVTASFGVAVFPHDVSDPAKLFETADRALYAAKSSGRNCVVQSTVEKTVETVASIYSNIEDRIQSVDLTVEITQGMHQTFIMDIRNNSDEDVVVVKVIFAHEGVKIAEWEPQKSETHSVRSRSNIAISWKPSLDPIQKLQMVRRIFDRNFETTMETANHAMDLKRLRIVQHKIMVQVDCGARRIWQL